MQDSLIAGWLKVISVLLFFAVVSGFAIAVAVAQIRAEPEPLKAETFADSIALCHQMFADDADELRQCVTASLNTEWAE